MKPEYVNGNVRAHCPDCKGALTTFEYRNAEREFGYIVIEQSHHLGDALYKRIIYRLLRCSTCGRGGLAKLHDTGAGGATKMEWFLPVSIERAKVPEGIPDGVVNEFREAELCAAHEAYRAASALFRSSLEKTLKANGYEKGNLADKIDEAAADGVITESRKRRAHEDIRVLGNDVLHEEWKKINWDDVEVAHHYIQRILEDLYGDRKTIEDILKSKGRITP